MQDYIKILLEEFPADMEGIAKHPLRATYSTQTHKARN